MPRGSKRNQRNRRTPTPHLPTPTGESQRSKAYEAGRAVKYAYRIHGPQYPITTYTTNQLPEGSRLT